MRIYAQNGFGPADKVQRGVDEGILDGVILSPRYCKPERMQQRIEELSHTGSFLAFDPEFYATDFIAHPTPNLGALEEWSYFRRPRRPELISGAVVPGLIRDALDVQINLGLKQLIAPNVYIRQADSIDTAVALNFLNNTKQVAEEMSEYPVYGTLAIHRDALLAGANFRDVLDSLTGIAHPPDGYYLIVGSSEQQSTGKYIRSDLSHPEVIAAWMYANYVLSLNAADVINGYCFLLSPLVGVCGAGAAANGWSSGLRKFCIERYVREQAGGKAPNIRYLSNPLMSHVRQSDLDAFSAIVPEVMNGLASDEIYEAAEPTRTEEALQAWEALRADTIQAGTGNENIEHNLSAFQTRINEARLLWETLRGAGFSQDVEPNLERLDAMDRGIDLFAEWAEIS